MTVDEGYFLFDRTRAERGLDPNFFPDAEEYECSWTSDLYAPSPSDFAWGVSLDGGLVYCVLRCGHCGVRAVCPGQF
jgi:hypothetical protein